MLTGDDYSSGHLVPSHLELAYVLLVETNPFPKLVVIFSGLFTSNIPRYFLDFALSRVVCCMKSQRGVSRDGDVTAVHPRLKYPCHANKLKTNANTRQVVQDRKI